MRNKSTHPVNDSLVGFILEVPCKGRNAISVCLFEDSNNLFVLLLIELGHTFLTILYRSAAHPLHQCIEVLFVDLRVKIKLGESTDFHDYAFVADGAGLVGVH